MMTTEKLKEIVKASENGDKFEIDFMNHLHDNNLMKKDIFNEENRQTVTKLRNQFIMGYNHGYKS